MITQHHSSSPQIARYATLCARDDNCRARTDDLAASIRQANAEIPDRWFFLPIKKSNVRIAAFMGMMESTVERHRSAPPPHHQHVALRRHGRRKRPLGWLAHR